MAVSLHDLHQSFQESSTIALFGHVNPDADALCSTLALREFILNNYLTKSQTSNKYYKKKIDIFIDCDEIPESLKVFAEKYKFNINPVPRKKYSLAIALDCLNQERLGNRLSIFQSANKTINIDHHKTNTKFAQINFVMDSSSTCENLYIIFNYLDKCYGAKMNNYILTQIYAGIITDTNNLENNADRLITRNNITSIVDNLGIKQASIVKAHFFKNVPKTKLALTTFSYKPKNRIHYDDGRICIVNLNYKVFAKTNATLDDAEGIVDSALNTEGVLISALILEPTKGKFTVKLRGKNIKVNTIAEQFNGGGHDFMAGFTYVGNYNILNMNLLKECKKVIEQSAENIETLEDILENE